MKAVPTSHQFLLIHPIPAADGHIINSGFLFLSSSTKCVNYYQQTVKLCCSEDRGLVNQVGHGKL